MGSSMIQGELWGVAASDWTELQEPLHWPVWEAMLKAASVGRDTRFFDAGCGGGGASVLAARRGALISGLDASEALIAIARRRLPRADLRVGDLEALPFQTEEFDAVMASMSVQYTADPVAALRELKRVCAPAGCFVISTWGLPEQCEQRAVFKAVRDSVASPSSGGGPFALSEPGLLERLVERADWKVVGNGEVDCPFEYKDFQTFWQAQRSSGPLQAAMRVVGEERLRVAVEQAVGPYRTATGGVRLENRFRYVTAEA